MEISLVLGVMDPDYIDSGHAMGVTNEGYEALTAALVNAGFEVVSGPDAVRAAAITRRPRAADSETAAPL